MEDNVFEIVDGEKTEKFKVRKPTLEDIREADKVYNRKMKDALDSGAMLRVKADEYLKKQGIWSDEKEAEVQALQKQIVDLELVFTVKGRRQVV